MRASCEHGGADDSARTHLRADAPPRWRNSVRTSSATRDPTRALRILAAEHPNNAALACRYEGPEGATVYNVAEITEVSPANGGTRVAVAAYHWHLCGPNELTLYTFPSILPVAERRPGVAGAGPDFTSVFALRLRQVSDSALSIDMLFYFDLFPGLPPFVHQVYYDGFLARVRVNLAETEYPPEGDEVCEAAAGSVLELGEYGI